MRPSRLPTLALLLAVAAGCDRTTSSSGDDSETGGTLVIALLTDIGQVLPPTIRQVEQKVVADQIFEPLAWTGDEGRVDGGFRPALANRWEWERDSLVLAFHLNPRAKWHDGRPVRASDVRFTFSVNTDPAVGSVDQAALARIDSVTVRDSLTPVFWFGSRYAEQMFDAAARMLIIPEHALAAEPRATYQTAAFGRNPIGSGRFRVAKWDPTTTIELVADTMHYRGRAKLDRVIFTPVQEPNALVARLSNGDIDAADITNSEHFRQLSAHPMLKSHLFPAFDYSFLQFNLRDPRRRDRPHPLFGDVAMRRALTLAVDRAQLVRSQFDTLARVALGPMTHAQPLADTTITPTPFDSAGAARMLDSLGWTLPAGKTVRERNGQPLRFRVLVPTASRNRTTMVVRLQEAYRKVGVDVVVDAMETNAFIGRMVKRDFDAVFNGTRAEVSLIGMRPYWSVAGAADPNSPNFGSYQNPQFDAHLDSALSARAAAEARTHAGKAFATIVADAPAVWMYEMRSAPVIHKRFRTAHMVPGAWWVGIAEWSVPSEERTDRDKVRLTTASR